MGSDPAVEPEPPARQEAQELAESAALPNEIEVDLDDIEVPIDLQPEPAVEETVGRTHPVDRADEDFGTGAPPLASWRTDASVRLVLTLLIVALLAVAGWYWHWRSTQGGGEAALASPLTAPPG